MTERQDGEMKAVCGWKDAAKSELVFYTIRHSRVGIKRNDRLIVADERHEGAKGEDDQADDAEGDGDVVGGDDAVYMLKDGEDGQREADKNSKQDGDLHARGLLW
jgi:hypothetical protein